MVPFIFKPVFTVRMQTKTGLKMQGTTYREDRMINMLLLRCTNSMSGSNSPEATGAAVRIYMCSEGRRR